MTTFPRVETWWEPWRKIQVLDIGATRAEISDLDLARVANHERYDWRRRGLRSELEVVAEPIIAEAVWRQMPCHDDPAPG